MQASIIILGCDMTYIFTPIVGFLLGIISFFVAPIAMLFALPLIRWDNEPSNGSYNQDPTIRGDLPAWLSWLSTPDERFPGGLYEPDVKNRLDTYGKLWCSYVWAGWRNQMIGLAYLLGKPATDFCPDKSGFWSGDGIWRLSVPMGPVRFVTGYKVYRSTDMTFRAVPVTTLKKALKKAL